MDSPADAAEGQIDEYIRTIGIEVVPATGAVDVTGELLRRYFAVEPPFEGKEKKKHEFPDAFALLSLEAFAKKRNKLLLCISPDQGWREFAVHSDALVCVPDLDEALSLFNQSGRHTADQIMTLWRAGSTPDLVGEIERAFEYRLDDVDFHADATSALEFEGESISAVMQWVDAKTASHPTVIATDDETITFTVNVEALVAFEANFSFYVKDSIDRDYVPLGARHSRQKSNSASSWLLPFSEGSTPRTV